MQHAGTNRAFLRLSFFLTLVVISSAQDQESLIPEDDEESVDLRSLVASEDEEDCLTPDNKRGSCIEHERCQSLASSRPNLDVLRRYMCGFSGLVPKVCCPNGRRNPVPTATRRTPRPVPPTRRPVTPTKRPVLPPRRRERPNRRPDPTTTTSQAIHDEITNRPRQLPRNCGRSYITRIRIVGGEESAVGAWPWLSALFIGKDDMCGGALISQNYILTAAHCVTNKSGTVLQAKEIKARLGDHDLFSSDDEAQPVDIDVAEVISHRDFSGPFNFYNDIALLRLKEPAKFNSFVQPICLPYDPPMRTENYEQRKAFVAGWGTTSFYGPSSSKLREVELPVWNQTSCREAYRITLPIINAQFCAGLVDGGKDACLGDSGGPLMLPGGPEKRVHLIGVVSFGKKCALPNAPGVYTNIRQYLDWITDNIRQ